MGKSITVGNFDGIHLGHRKLFNELEKGIIISFEPPAKALLDLSFKRLFLKDERRFLFKEILKIYDGNIRFEFLEFDSILMQLSWIEFLEFLYEKYKFKRIVAGKDWKFGKNRIGNIKKLKVWAKLHGIEVKVVNLEGKEKKYASTNLRNFVEKAEFERFFKCTDYNYFIRNFVKKGEGLGRSIGTKTLNFNYENARLYPKHGVYFTITDLDGKFFKSITFIGKKSIGEFIDYPVVETHILNEDLDNIEEATVYFGKFLRNPIIFKNKEQLRKQILSDIDKRDREKIFIKTVSGDEIWI